MRRVKGKMREENNLKRKGREITGKPDERGVDAGVDGGGGGRER